MPSFEEVLAEAAATLAHAKPARKPFERSPDNPSLSHRYIPFRNVYQFYMVTCACGRHWQEFDGIYLDRRIPALQHSNWLRLAELPTDTLPREREDKPITVPYCEECAHAPSQSGQPEH